MATRKNRQGTAWSVPWATSPAYEKKKGGGDVRSAQGYDGQRPDDERRGLKVEKRTCDKVRMATWNVGTMSRRSGEVVEVMVRRKIDFCCVQESRWKGSSARMLGRRGNRFKFFYQGCERGDGGVGVLVAERWIDSVVKVTRVNERLMYVKILVGKQLVNVISAYAPQVGKSAREKDAFWELALTTVINIPRSEVILLGGDLNGHVGRAIDGYHEIHGGFGYGTRNGEGERILEFCDALELALCNTWFPKDESKLVTYSSGGHQSVIDYIAVRTRDRTNISNTKVISSEECVSQHRLMLAEVSFKSSSKSRRKYVPRLKVWKLRHEAVAAAFNDYVSTKEQIVDSACGSEKWSRMEEVWLDAAEQFCGWTKGPARHKETWWWNGETERAVEKKKRLFHVWQRSRSDSDRTAYLVAKREAKSTIWHAQEAKRSEFSKQLENEFSQGKSSFFRAAKQMAKEQVDVTRSTCIKNEAGEILASDMEVKRRWKQYAEKIMNEENEWQNETNFNPVLGPWARVEAGEVEAALKKMPVGKSSGPSGVVAEMIKATWDHSVKWLTDLCNSLLDEGTMPNAWCLSTSVPLYKGKGDPLNCGSYRNIKLLEHGMKVVERVIDVRLRAIVKLNEMQFGFVPGKGTTDAIFIIRQLQEKHLAKNRDLFFAFVDLEKAFDRVPREVLRWSLRKAEVPEYLVNAVMALYLDSSTVVRTSSGDSESFPVRVGVHQGSVLSPFLFDIVMDQVSSPVREGLPWELLYADDLVLIATSKEELLTKLGKWMCCLASKGLKINPSKTKIMVSSSSSDRVVESANWPCGVCSRGVGVNSIFCTQCHKWVHKRCSGISGRLPVTAPRFVCRTCCGLSPPPPTGNDSFVVQDQQFEKVRTFCYLGDTLSEAGGSDAAVTSRVRCAWKKFHELASFLTSRATPLKVKGRVYDACVRSVMTYGSETWAMKAEQQAKLERTDNDMVRRMCGVRLSDRERSEDLRRRLQLTNITDVLRRSRLRWFGHVHRRSESDWLKKTTHMEVEGRRSAGRPRKTWTQSVTEDLRRMRLDPALATNREEWRRRIWKRPSNPV